MRVLREVAAVEEKRRVNRWKEVRRWGRVLNTWAVIIGYTVFLCGFGVVVGHNFLSKAVLCDSQTPCAFLRFLPEKVIAPAKQQSK